MTLRVLQVISDRDRRGAQCFALELERHLQVLGAEVTTVACARGRLDDSVSVDVLGPSARHPSTWRALRRRARSADVTVAHGSTTLLACAMALGGSGRPFVYRQVSDPVRWTSTPARRARVGVMLRRSAQVVALSEAVRAVMARRYRLEPGRLAVIPNGADGEWFRPPCADERADARARLRLGDSEVLAVQVGALSMEKGPDQALDALRVAPGVSLLLVGSGPHEDRIRSMACRIGQDRARFYGVTEDVRTIYWAADIVVQASRSESMPAALIEAGLCAVPAVAFDVGSIAEIVVDGRTGALCAPGDVMALGQAVRWLAQDRDVRQLLGSQARAWCQSRFDIRAVVRRWHELLVEVAAA